ncbi:MAG: HIT family protein [Thermoguttaceae bacterium]
MQNNDVLWAPWRLDFITEDSAAKKERDELNKIEVGAGADPRCFLCQAVAENRGLEWEKKRHIFFCSELTIGVLNLFPYNNGHLLIAPKRHVAKLSDLTEAERDELMRQINRWTSILEEKMCPDGFNIGLNLGHAAGAGLPGHLHWHIVPRWVGDTNFMTAIGSTKVIPQSLDALWELLYKETVKK